MHLRQRLPSRPACERCARPAPARLCLTRVGPVALGQVLARFAWHEAELPFSEADGLRWMIFELGQARSRVHTQPNARAGMSGAGRAGADRAER